ncbi:MAG TPA: BrnT family toxin [Burkholderiales bacterium]|nr:BrnT family toxin [Burkholderiales bacterium]
MAEDLRKEYGEQRFQALGLVAGRLHAMVFTPRSGKVHVISLRKANRREVRRYESQA